MCRSSHYVAARHKAFPCVLAFAVAAAFFCCLSYGVSAASGKNSIVLKCVLDQKFQAGMTATLSHTADRYSATLKSSSEGTHEFKLEGRFADDISFLKPSAVLGVSGLLVAPEDTACWRQLSSTVGIALDRKAYPWQPEARIAMTVREYPLDGKRNYTEGNVRVKAGRSYTEPLNATVRLEATAGHKEMPANPKWTANYWESSATVRFPLGSVTKGSVDISARGRAYPEAEHKSYRRAACKLTGIWTPSKVHSIDCGVAAVATVREKDRSKDKTETTISGKWSLKPSPYWSADAKGSLSFSIQPNQPDAGSSVRTSTGLTLTCMPAKSFKLIVAGDMSVGHTLDGGDDEEAEESVYAQSETDSKSKIGLVLGAKLGPLNGVTLDGKVRLKRESKQANSLWEHGKWAPSAEIQASMKF